MPYPRAGRAQMCQHCHQPILAVGVPYLDWPVPLEDHELPITADLAALRRARPGGVWEWAGPNIGWIDKLSDNRTWRPLRAYHNCTNPKKESAQ